MNFGLLLPHFGGHAAVSKCLDGAIRSEPYGFNSVWVRDHLVFTPYAMEGSDRTHLDGLQILSAVSPVTKKLTLGTAITIAHRHPIHLAQSLPRSAGFQIDGLLWAWDWEASPRVCVGRTPKLGLGACRSGSRERRNLPQPLGRAQDLLPGQYLPI